MAMAEHPLADRLDAAVDAIVARADATAALSDPELAPLVRVAADLRFYPDPEFKARLRAQLERRTVMTTVATDSGVREGFATVTPYIRVAEAGLLEFLVAVFEAKETMSGRGGGGGMHREVRIGDSMVIIGEGATPGAVMPVRPMAFHVFVDDVDAAIERAIAAGASLLGPAEDRHYGERAGFVTDPFGNRWYIATPTRPGSLAYGQGTVTPVLHVNDASDYIEFLERALGATTEIRTDPPGTALRYARLRVGDAAVEVGESDPLPGSFLLYVSDPDAWYDRALSAGASSLMPPSDQSYGRLGGVEDVAGNQWFFSKPA